MAIISKLGFCSNGPNISEFEPRYIA